MDSESVFRKDVLKGKVLADLALRLLNNGGGGLC